jgi:hypothetical protein
LKDSGEQSQQRFLLIGTLYVFINLIIFFSFFGLFVGVFERFLAGVFGAFLMTFVIGNIYRLTLISLEPQTLPTISQKGSLRASMFVRYIVVCLFAIFVAKSLETTLFGYLVDGEVESHMESLVSRGESKFVYQESSLFLEHMIMLNKHQPWVWVITVLVVLFFVAPIVLRSALRKRKEYYSIKKIIDKAMVDDFYKNTKSSLHQLYINLYRQREKVTGKKLSFQGHHERYYDPPYNTRLKSINPRFDGTMTDFANLDW